MTAALGTADGGGSGFLGNTGNTQYSNQSPVGGYGTGLSQFDELKQMVTATLERRGVLAKLQAQLRSHLFGALIEQETKDKSLIKPQLQGSNASKLALELIKEYLRFHCLDFTLSQLTVESGLPEISVMTRTSMAQSLGIGAAQKAVGDRPLLVEFLESIIEKQQQYGGNLSTNINGDNNHIINEERSLKRATFKETHLVTGKPPKIDMSSVAAPNNPILSNKSEDNTFSGSSPSLYQVSSETAQDHPTENQQQEIITTDLTSGLPDLNDSLTQELQPLMPLTDDIDDDQELGLISPGKTVDSDDIDINDINDDDNDTPTALQKLLDSQSPELVSDYASILEAATNELEKVGKESGLKLKKKSSSNSSSPTKKQLTNNLSHFSPLSDTSAQNENSFESMCDVFVDVKTGKLTMT